jgi:hypothetical protein
VISTILHWEITKGKTDKGRSLMCSSMGKLIFINCFSLNFFIFLLPCYIYIHNQWGSVWYFNTCIECAQPLFIHLPSPFSQPLVIPVLCLDQLSFFNFLFLTEYYSVFPCLACFTYHSILKFHPFYCKSQVFILVYGWIVIHYV